MIVSAVYLDLDEEYVAETALSKVDCVLRASNGALDFGFSDKVIRVTFSYFIQDYTLLSGSHYCAAGVLPISAAPVLGNSFLRAAYVVFDWDNINVYLAQAANYGFEMVSISSGEDAVPSQHHQLLDHS
ncbi:hypothetical protein NKR23_g7203 [Pleurostoma richardsiae]|uniref:Peptidase A1 domain-containing protein n=1 Tax=Pleurostoma richardsiae TaxID=41990 RepID=A0AA38RBU1_9PEZI|nr:hypothetical protein NKR23_g7203 [Pleurostoma richardsiae]